ncbi:hypothetical protein PybrP1_004425, partial [[Pythium] brassicae (nom. inval.)]
SHRKKVKYEVVCDTKDNCITMCNMENFDLLGIHMGDSIVVAPSQTLSNSEYFRLRAAVQKVVRYLDIVGECNIQYALGPHSERYFIIVVNTRLSRSSALASKATGYPLVYVANKTSLGIDLVNIKNSVTKATTACFEPSLDYCVVKMPRWNLQKFSRVSNDLGSSMLSVGELARISTLRCAIPHYSLATVDERVLRVLKVNGFSGRQIAAEWPGATEFQARARARRKQLNIVPIVKQINTLAAEFPVQTNYLYITYGDSENDVGQSNEDIVVLGCGPYCIGSSVDFDWCAVSAVHTVRELGKPAVVVNCNPETVSTDYDESDWLYFEELTLERTLDIYDPEQPEGATVSVGGQIPNNLAMSLHKAGVAILGTYLESIDRCEDRNRFSALLDTLGVYQPHWAEVKGINSALAFSADVSYPCSRARATCSPLQLREYLRSAAVAFSRSVSISKSILHAKEVDFDGIAKDGVIINYAILEHVENAGKLYVGTIKQVKRIASAIANALHITGPFNIQLKMRNNDVKVIECNLRAPRRFISKTFDLNFINLAAKAMLGPPVKSVPIGLTDIDNVGVKAPQFSFTRLHGADPTLGVEMASTGEVACFGTDMHEEYLKALLSAGFKMPKERKVLISISNEHIKREFTKSTQILQQMGYTNFATPGAVAHLVAHGINATVLRKPSDDGAADTALPDVIGYFSQGKIELLINVPDGSNREELSPGSSSGAWPSTLAVHKVKKHEVCDISEYYAMPTIGWRPGQKLTARKMSIY